MKLALSKKDVALHIVHGFVATKLAATPAVKSLLELDDKQQLTETFSISQALLQLDNSSKQLLGLNEEDQVNIFQHSLQADNDWREKMTKNRDGAILELNGELGPKTFFCSNYFTLADIILFSTLYKFPFKPNDRMDAPNVVRYYDLIQNIVKPHILSASLEMVEFELDVPMKVAPIIPVKQKQGKESEKPKKEKAAKPAKEEKPKIDPSKLDIIVGRILNVEKHPEADALYVETVDVGEKEPRTVVSGLVKYMSPQDLQDKLVLLLCNLKPAKMRGIESQAMVLCATSENGEVVELVNPPLNAKPGDIASFESFKGNEQFIVGKPEEMLKSKQKIWESIQPQLKTNGKLEATFISPETKQEFKLLVGNDVCMVKTVTGASIK